jgi:hypothetical protein
VTAPRPGLFTARDPGARAERIARALISDIVAYHPERQAECLAAGTLRAEFRDEIMKSWEEYVAQVGLETAKSTPYFRNALNGILAKGARSSDGGPGRLSQLNGRPRRVSFHRFRGAVQQLGGPGVLPGEDAMDSRDRERLAGVRERVDALGGYL